MSESDRPVAPGLTAAIGRCSSLRVMRIATPGVYLDGGALGEILLPGRYVARGTLVGETIEVFVHRDSEDRLMATTETPRAQAGEFALLRVVSADPRIGAFLDWGLSKDLLLPIREQARPVRVGESVVALVLVDARTDRLIATTRIGRHLDRAPPAWREGDPVDLLITGRTELGYNAIVAGAHRGLLYHNELPDPLEVGQKLAGYVRAVRPDGKIDLTLHPSGHRRVAPLRGEILEALSFHGGQLALGDHSSPAEIREAFGASKKAFKQAIGALYRERRIVITATGIRLASPPPDQSSANCSTVASS
jgi:predicted RNA-binding protein (virulence factor B family)